MEKKRETGQSSQCGHLTLSIDQLRTIRRKVEI